MVAGEEFLVASIDVGAGAGAVKFLVLWRIELTLLSKEMAGAVARMSDYGAELERAGKVLHRYHVIGAHGGAWIYEVDSARGVRVAARARAGVQLRALRGPAAGRDVAALGGGAAT